MLKTNKEIKKYVMNTIKNGNKERIQSVLKRYFKRMKENKTEKMIQEELGDIL